MEKRLYASVDILSGQEEKHLYANDVVDHTVGSIYSYCLRSIYLYYLRTIAAKKDFGGKK
jgi:hypothetical protein